MQLPLLDIVVIAVYIVVTVLFGSWFVRRSRTTDGFTRAGGRVPMAVVGLSIFGTFVSSISFLAIPGKAFASNWNSYVWSLTLLPATWVAARYFVPFYRSRGHISTYAHLESRFGTWARVYASVCYMVTQIARMGAVMFLVALPLNLLLGWDIVKIILVIGILTTLYSMLGGIEGVVWTDALQSLILILGTLLCTGILLFGTPGGPEQVFKIAVEQNKFSLGSFDSSISQSTFWVVLIYGIAINLQNFGIDQNFVQRYQTARSDKDARRSLWLNAWLYIVVSAFFFFIGTALYSFYTAQPESLPAEMLADMNARPIAHGDQFYPFFIIHQLPAGLTGLLIAAIFSAAMSTISTSLNGCATLTLTDFYKRFYRPNAGAKEEVTVLYVSTAIWGGLGIGGGLLFTHAKQILDAWWGIQGIFGGGILGLFLLGFFSRRAKNVPAVIGTVLGLLVIAWMSLSLPSWKIFPERWAAWRSPFHEFLIPVIGTAVIFLSGFLLTMLFAPFKGKKLPAGKSSAPRDGALDDTTMPDDTAPRD